MVSNGEIKMEIAFEPYKKLTFQSHLIYQTLEELLDVIVSGSPAGVPFQTRLYWANGILFRHFNHPQSESLAKEIISGHMILDHIEFCPMDKFISELKSEKRPMGRIIVLDVSKHVVFGPLTAWLKKNLLEN